MPRHLCPQCRNYSARRFISVLWHIQRDHIHESLHLKCGVDGCPKGYSSVVCLRRHLQKYHPMMLTQRPETSNSSQQDMDTGNEGNDEYPDDESTPATPLAENESRHMETCMRSAALFIIKAREVKRLPQDTIDALLVDTRDLFASMVEHQNAITKDLIDAAGIDISTIPGLARHLEVSPNPFHGLETEYSQTKYLRNNLGLLEPIERCLGRQIVARQQRGQRVLAWESKCCYDIDLKQSLEQLLNNEAIYEQVTKPHASHDGFLRDMCDGQYYKEHPLYCAHPDALQLHLFYDDVEVVNPLGTKTKKHKLSMFYYIIGNIPPQHRSTLAAIQLVAVVKHEHLAEYGIDTILKPFIDAVGHLETGTQMIIGGTVKTVYGTLLAVSGDNLGSQLIAGYKQLASATRKCRFCMATSKNINKEFCSSKFRLRTKRMYQSHCEKISTLGHDYAAKAYGITRNAALNRLVYFHVVDGLPPDVMHDLLEGAVNCEVKVMLRTYIYDKELFTLTRLNDRMKFFKYSQEEAVNKPTEITREILTSSSRTNLKQKAAQMWTMARNLPAMIGDLIPQGDRHWETFLTLLEILDICMAPVISEELTWHLSLLIRGHHESYTEIYPERPLLPKQHYMIHYPEWMRKFGPLIRLWCMRFEAKHSYFKSLANNLGNHKNLSKTMATRHQHLMCYYLANNKTFSNFYHEDSVTTGIVTSMDIAQCNITDGTIPPNVKTIYRVSWAKVHSHKYFPGCIVAIREARDMPVFATTKDVYVYNTCIVLLHVEELSTIYFNHHLHAYNVIKSAPPVLRYIHQQQLLDAVPLSLLSLSQGYHIVCHHRIIP